MRFDGPAGAGESRPDLSGTGAPIRIGLVTEAALISGLPPGSVACFAHGSYNWRVSVWRRQLPTGSRGAVPRYHALGVGATSALSATRPGG